jgi:2-polyprenyl-3-methyl-5-hydroxy-6-metoxy-1,4-benzoquinol methylase
VLEHVPDAHAFLEQLRNLLRPAAPVYIEVPQQFDSILDRIARRLGRKNCYSEYSIHHHYFFSPNALTALLEANGFEITSMTSFLRCRRQGRRSGPRKWALQTLLQVANILGRRGDVIAVWARRTR